MQRDECGELFFSEGETMEVDVVEEISSQCVAGRVRLLNRRITALYDETLRPVGITSGQLNMLTFIGMLAPITPGVLSDRLQMEKSTTSRNIARMERNGWISVSTGEQAHTRLLKLTRKGRSVMKRALPYWRKAQREVEELLGEGGVDDVVSLFHRMSVSS
jgi:DNA-binding MarR family transcriptional regulator